MALISCLAGKFNFQPFELESKSTEMGNFVMIFENLILGNVDMSRDESSLRYIKYFALETFKCVIFTF